MTNVERIVGGVPLSSIPADLFETYERRMVPAVFEPWGRRLVDAAGIAAGDRVLDVACGTGIVARLAARRVGPRGAVMGFDALPQMLDVARAVPTPAGAPIDWLEGDAVDLPLPDHTVDVVVCQQGLQFFVDRTTALAHARRVLVPGGRIALSVWRGIEHSPAVAVLQRALERRAPEVGGFLPLAFSLGDAEQLRAELGHAGFQRPVLWTEVRGARFSSVSDFVETYLGATPVGGVVAGLPDEVRAELLDEVVEHVSDHCDDHGLLVVQESCFAMATAPT